MVQIAVTAEQAMRIGEMSEPIEILDPQGKSIGIFTKPSSAPLFSSEEIAEAKRRSKSPAQALSSGDMMRTRLGSLPPLASQCFVLHE